MKRPLVLICLFFLCFKLNSQSVFTNDLNRDIAIGTLALGVSIAPFFMNNQGELIPTELNKDDINSFDRTLMFSYNRPLAILSGVPLYGLLILPIIYVSRSFTDKDVWLTYGLMYAQSALLVYGTSEILKRSIGRYRPYNYFGDIPSGFENDYYKSFLSRHTAFAFMSASFLTTAFFAEEPESSWKIPVMLGSYTLATGVAALRISSGMHFLTDVLAGAALGTFFGWVIPTLNKNMSLNIAGNGIILSFRI